MPQPTHNPWQLGPAIANCLLPGLGHIFLRQKTRGLIIMITILSLFSSGLLIGGIDVVDSKQDTLWFLGQALVGPAAFIIDFTHQRLKPTDATQPFPPLNNRPDPAYHVSLGRANEIGTLFCAIAGILNLLVFIDLVYYTPPKPQPLPVPRGQSLSRNSSS